MSIARQKDKEILVHIYIMEYYSAIKKNTFELSSNEVDETGSCYTE